MSPYRENTTPTWIDIGSSRVKISKISAIYAKITLYRHDVRVLVEGEWIFAVNKVLSKSSTSTVLEEKRKKSEKEYLRIREIVEGDQFYGNGNE